MNKTKWRLSMFSSGWKMTRSEGQAIAVRELTLFEKIFLIHRWFTYKGIWWFFRYKKKSNQ